jgi:folate-dependent phosphoribosylglycinamide formyltransferase PurN
MSQKKIILLATDCDTTHILYNFLITHFDIKKVVLEDSISKKILIKRRIKKLGLLKVVGQLAFIVLVLPFIKRSSKRRKNEIADKYNLRFARIPEEKIKRIESVNSEEAILVLKEIMPDLIIVNGPRIISKRILNSSIAPFINIHTGITPQFRGVHGGYWAIATGNNGLFGTTIHQVDSGIDTGRVLNQTVITPDKSDTFFTYPYLQYAICLPEIKKIIDNYITKGELDFKEPITGKSALWYHPTIWQWFRLPRKVT